MMKKRVVMILVVLATVVCSLMMFVSAAEADTMYVTGNNVRERTAPNTKAEIATTHNKGKDLEVTEIYDGWALLDNGNYMSADYLVPEAQAAELFDNLPMYVLGTKVRERSTPDTTSTSNIQTMHEAGEIVYVAAKLNGWYQLTNGNYISADLLSADYQDIVTHFLENGYNDIVFVSITHQKVGYFKNGELIVSGSCVTGKASKTPTPIGLYTIGHKNTDFDMNGDPNTHVQYAAFFNGGIAFHDAPWRSRFGGEIYKNNGSHGCINCPLDLAKTIYNESRRGSTYVLVIP